MKENLTGRQAVCDHLECGGYDIRVFDTVGSTNDIIRQLANEGLPQGVAVIAKSQTAGRGKPGRSFYSPQNTGLYMSILLRPEFCARDCPLITTAAAVAVASAAERISGRQAKIKWVNDVYMNGGKICGILTESALRPGTDRLDFAVLGIGVNVYPPEGGFPNDIEHIAAAVFDGDKKDENLIYMLAAYILDDFGRLYKNIPDRIFLEEYKKRLFILGKTVFVQNGEERYKATAEDIDGDCRLLVRREDGRTEYLSAGEVSLKPFDGKWCADL